MKFKLLRITFKSGIRWTFAGTSLRLELDDSPKGTVLFIYYHPQADMVLLDSVESMRVDMYHV